MKITVDLYSNTFKYKGTIDIYPLDVCGEMDLTYYGRVVEAKGCPVDDNHDTAGGRHRKVLEVPKGFRVQRLTYGETNSVYSELRALQIDPEKYIVPDTVHGAWKISCRQGAVLVKDYSVHA